MTMLVRIAREFDLLVVQEVRDVSERVADEYLLRINAAPGADYAMYEGPRLGRSSSKEQYVIYYLPNKIELIEARILPDPEDVFEREPLIASFRAGNFDFILVAIHIKPSDARQELGALAGVTQQLVEQNPNERDVILLGDFNADCSYFSEADNTHPLRASNFHWVITDEMDTNVGASSCTYDRIILLDGTYQHEYLQNSANVFRYDVEYHLSNLSLVQQVSDHYPVYAEFKTSLPDDD